MSQPPLCPRGRRAVVTPGESGGLLFSQRPPLPSAGWSLALSSYGRLSGSRGSLSEPFLTLTSWFVLVLPQKHYFPINYRVSVPYEGVLRMANITRLVRTPPGLGDPLLGWETPASWDTPRTQPEKHISLGRSCCQGPFPALGPSLPLAEAPRLLLVYHGCPCSAPFMGPRGAGGDQSSGGAGPEAHVCRPQRSLLSPQQRARVSQRELRYLWVWVSLSATESVQEVLLEGHPSWKYLEEVRTLLLDVQQSLTVSCAQLWAWGRACAQGWRPGMVEV